MPGPSVPAPAWPQRYPQRWEQEVAGFAAAGAVWRQLSPDPAGGAAVPAPDEQLIVELDWPNPNPDPRPDDPEALSLLVTFPALYPWAPPRVALPDPPAGGIGRHRNPLTGELCLLGETSDWHVDTTVAQLLTRQLPVLLAAGRSHGPAGPAGDRRVVSVQEIGAEPVWTRMWLSSGGVLVDSSWMIPADVGAGLAELRLVSGAAPLPPVHRVVALVDSAGGRLAGGTAFGGGSGRGLAAVPWVRLDVPATGRLDPAVLWGRAVAALPAGVAVADRGPAAGLLLVLLPSENATGRCEDFVMLNRLRPDPDSAGTEPEGEPDATVLVRRSYGIGPADLAARLGGDRHSRLQAARAAVVGIGALGGPVAVELGRAGIGSLLLIDPDTVDPATTARQVSGYRDAGLAKTLSVGGRVIAHSPHTKVDILPFSTDDLSREDLTRLLDCDLLIDATANRAATRLLTAHAHHAAVATLVVTATAGGRGGRIVTLPADGGGCHECLQLHTRDRTMPRPPADAGAEVQPAGCSHPTYTGAAPDLLTVAVQAARTALELLAPTGTTTTLPGLGGNPFGDVQLLRLHDGTGPTPPSWETHLLTPHPDCPLHPAAGPRQLTLEPCRG